MSDSLRDGSPRSSLMEVKESEVQGRRREAGSEGSVERKREPMNKNRIGGCFGRTSQHVMTKSTSIKDQGSKSGGCAWKIVRLTSGGLCCLEVEACLGTWSEKIARFSDRSTEVSRGHSRSANSIRLSETLPRKGRNSQGSQDRRGTSKARTVLSPSGEGEWCGSKDPNLVSEQCQNIQLRLAFTEGNEGEALKDSDEGTDAPTAKKNSSDPVNLTSRTAVVRTRTPGGVGGGNFPPYPDLLLHWLALSCLTIALAIILKNSWHGLGFCS
ncbi:hypothetical protein [uncultured Rubinisphaera sp.]|uniref:hypothetical protein n=1 Tax=uncultured Rubinisphaera sp. TaxID=1678686 RepID=UPI0030D9C02D